MSLYKYSREDSKQFFEMVHATPSTSNVENIIPNAPKKSKKITSMMNRWKCHGIVKELFPKLSSKNETYNSMVNSLDNLR